MLNGLAAAADMASDQSDRYLADESARKRTVWFHGQTAAFMRILDQLEAQEQGLAEEAGH